MAEEPQWFVGEEATVTYTLETNAGLYLDTWDWIGLYKVAMPITFAYRSMDGISQC